MKVLLCTDIDNLGYIGEVVEVKNGYARNFLLPQGYATVPTEANIASLAQAKEEAAKKRMQKRQKLEDLLQRLEGAEAVIAENANEQGHLFGSVTEKNIAENLQKQGFEISDKMIRMHEHLKEIGTHIVDISIAQDLNTQINVVVVSQQDVEKQQAETEKTQEENKSQEETVESADKDISQ